MVRNWDQRFNDYISKVFHSAINLLVIDERRVDKLLTMADSTLMIREAIASDDVLIAEHLCHIALQVGVLPESICPDWLDKSIEFIERARCELQYKGFIAEINGQIVGLASCQILELYPMVSQDYQKEYMWGVHSSLGHADSYEMVLDLSEDGQ